MNAILIFVKYPAPGKVKTRLGDEIGHPAAAGLYRVFVELTFEITKRSRADKVFVAFEPAELAAQFDEILPPEFERFPQQGAGLGERLSHAVGRVLAGGMTKVVTIGSDSPSLPVALIDRAFERLDEHDLVLGPAEDGGYYLIGMKSEYSSLFQKVRWSSASVLEATLQNAKALDLAVSLLPVWYDVDDSGSLARASKDDATGRIRAYLDENQLELS